MTRSRTRLLTVLLALSLSATACGSTVQTTGGALPGGGSAVGSDGLTAPEFGVPGSTDGTTATGGVPGTGGTALGGSSGTTGSGTSTGSTGTTGTGGAAVPGAPGSSTGGGAGAAPGGFVQGPGTSATAIKLGIPYCNDCAAGNAAAGVAGEDPGDTRRYYQAALDEVNGRGGVVGRKLEPVFHEISVSDNIDASAQAACETFTQDNEVAMVVFRGEIAASCAQKAGVIALGGGGAKPFYDKYRNSFSPGFVRLDRLGAVTVRAMVAAGWQKTEARWPTGRIGLVAWADADYEYAVEQGWKPALREAGLELTDERYITVPQNAGALADASASISSAVLAFRQQGIDHVFLVDGAAGIFAGAGLTTLFLQNAQSQEYFPRYGFNGNNSPDFDPYPAEQQSGMLAVENFSTEAAQDEGIAPNSQRERCFDVMRKKGLPVGQSQTQNLAILACDIAWFAEAAFTKGGGTTLERGIAGAEALGTSYRSPFAYGTRLGPDQHDGGALFRNARYDDACQCMKYTSAPVPL